MIQWIVRSCIGTGYRGIKIARVRFGTGAVLAAKDKRGVKSTYDIS